MRKDALIKPFIEDLVVVMIIDQARDCWVGKVKDDRQQVRDWSNIPGDVVLLVIRREEAYDGEEEQRCDETAQAQPRLEHSSYKSSEPPRRRVLCVTLSCAQTSGPASDEDPKRLGLEGKGAEVQGLRQRQRLQDDAPQIAESGPSMLIGRAVIAIACGASG